MDLKSDRIILAFSILKFLIHFGIALFAGYGIFRDELYYLACSDHLSLGYVDHPPLSVYLLKFWTLIGGDSIAWIRTLPALAGGVTVFFLGRSIREMGGGIIAISIGCIAYIISLINLAFTSIYSMNVFDLMFWSISFYLVIRIIKTENEKLWITLGIILGLGLLNKISTLFLGAGIFMGLLLSPQRNWLKTVWPYLGAWVALLIFSPYLIWNVLNDWPHLAFIESASGSKYSGLSAWSFISGQFLINHPFNFLLYMLGLGYLLMDKRIRKYRALAIIFIATFLILAFNGSSKSEYLAGAMTILYAGGGVLIESWTRKARWIQILILVILASGIGVAPLAAPILPAERFIEFSQFLRLGKSNDEGKEEAELPQFYADMHGWEQKARKVSEIFSSLSEEEKKTTIIFTGNYGRAGCMDYYRNQYELPRSYSGHNHYSFWGPEPNQEITTLILMQGEVGDIREVFESVEVIGTISCTYCMPYENNLKIILCRQPRISIQELWPELIHYD